MPKKAMNSLRCLKSEMAQKDAEKRARMQALRAAVEQEQRKGQQ